jgi:hypothetical protein
MRKLTQFGKRVMATMALIVASAAVIGLGFMILGNQACKLHINQQAFNVLAIMVVLPILCTVIASAYCSIRDSKLA